ncbi:sterol-sensing domain [Anaeramoeba flamelloides]|uniref:Sterol-sensing domain n=1 Tax=Anaeramoeba flamelloides TaxID=1746091 RepID=A0AAV7ZEE1_9EUKA|nr:sterol-sensing domain [Anaeramoeba flamelloides]
MKNKDKQIDKKGLNPVVVFIVDHPWWMIILSMGIALTMIGTSFAFDIHYDATMGSFVVRKGKTANQIEGMTMVFREEGYFDHNTYEYLLEEKDPQSQVSAFLKLYYECTDCDNVLTESHLKKIYEFEQGILNDKRYQDFCFLVGSDTCFPPTTGINFFFDEDGKIVDDIEEAAKTLYNDQDGVTRSLVCDKNFDEENLKVKYLSSTFMFGYPLEGYKNKDDRTDDQDSEYEEWILDLVSDMSDTYESDDFEILFLGTGVTMYALNTLITHDVILVVFSIVMVYGYTLFHTKSVMLASLGILHVVISLGMSFFFYVAILRVQWFTMLTFLSLFVILGIGCDDIFIMLDAWRQSKHEKHEISKNKYTRMNWSYNRATSAMLITTLTSSGAFFGNIASTIPPIRYFGIFTGMAIVFNFLMVITWYPAVIIIWDRNGESQCCCGSCCQKKKKKEKNNNRDDLDSSDFELEKKKSSEKKDKKGHDDQKLKDLSFSSETSASSNSRDDSANNSFHSKTDQKKKKTQEKEKEKKIKVDDLRFLEKYFYKYHASWIKKYRWAIVIIFLGIAIGFGIQASKLEPSEEPSEYLPDDNFLMRAYTIESEHFSTGDMVGTIYIQWGVKSIDRDGVDPLEVDELGKPIYDEDWKPNLKSSQEWFIEVCERVREKYEGTVYRDGQLLCFMEDFRDWVTNETLAGAVYSFPVEEDQFQGLLAEYTNYARLSICSSQVENSEFNLPYYYCKTVSFDKQDDDLLQYNMQFNLIIDALEVAEVTRPIFDDIEDFLDTLNKEAPEGMGMAATISDVWMRMLTEEIMITVALTTIFVSLGIAFLIILISTKNYITSTLAILSIGGVVVTIIGMMISLGWSLGAVESISLTIIVGISVDYIVHFCHAYNVSNEETAFEKLREAMYSLGISVTSAAITTLMSSFVLFFTYIIFFKHFGIFIWMTILSSVLWSFIFFFTLLVFVGPTGDKGKITLLFKKYFCKDKYNEYLKKKKKNTDKVPEQSSSTSNDPNLDDSNFKDIENNVSPKTSIQMKKEGTTEKKKNNKSKKIKKVKQIVSSKSSSSSSSSSDSSSD